MEPDKVDVVNSTSKETIPKTGDGWFEATSNFIDENIRVVRLLPWIIGGIGAYLVIKHTYFFKQFKCASKVPLQLIRQNYKLSGRVVECNWDSLGVWHVPLGRRLLRWRTKPPDDNFSESPLRIKFAGVAITEPEKCHKWLETSLKNQLIKFTLLHYQAEQNAIESAVYTKRRKLFRQSFNVNEALIANGLGSLSEVKGFHDYKSYIKFMSTLGHSEVVAKKKGMGMWAGSEYETWWRKIWRFKLS